MVKLNFQLYRLSGNTRGRIADTCTLFQVSSASSSLKRRGAITDHHCEQTSGRLHDSPTNNIPPHSVPDSKMTSVVNDMLEGYHKFMDEKSGTYTANPNGRHHGGAAP